MVGRDRYGFSPFILESHFPNPSHALSLSVPRGNDFFFRGLADLECWVLGLILLFHEHEHGSYQMAGGLIISAGVHKTTPIVFISGIVFLLVCFAFHLLQSEQFHSLVFGTPIGSLPFCACVIHRLCEMVEERKLEALRKVIR